MTVHDYLHMMLANDAVREQILKLLPKLERILSKHGCSVVEQLSDFDLDVIEEFLHLCRMIVFHLPILAVSQKE